MTDFHTKGFSEETLLKLTLFKNYLREWIPVFVARRNPIWKNVNIIDFFAGPGSDSQGNKGSPLLIIDAVEEHLDKIREKEIHFRVILSEPNRKKNNQLSQIIEKKRNSLEPVTFEIFSKEFQILFDQILPSLENAANLIFLDQSGIKQITDEVFKKLISLEHTDFLFFISSQTIYRFSENPSIKKYLDMSAINMDDHYQVHRKVCEWYRSCIPEGETYFIAPFSLKNKGNIYGLIFGSGHPRGMEKFLRSCWKIDTKRGEANFDIDREGIIPNDPQQFLFPSEPTKVALFEEDLTALFKQKCLKYDRDIYLYAITNGFLPEHARDVCKRAKKDGILSEYGRISYDGYKEPRKIKYGN